MWFQYEAAFTEQGVRGSRIAMKWSKAPSKRQFVADLRCVAIAENLAAKNDRAGGPTDTLGTRGLIMPPGRKLVSIRFDGVFQNGDYRL